jgi:hypothetical protein
MSSPLSYVTGNYSLVYLKIKRLCFNLPRSNLRTRTIHFRTQPALVSTFEQFYSETVYRYTVHEIC